MCVFETLSSLRFFHTLKMHPREKTGGEARGPNRGQLLPNTVMSYYVIMSFWPDLRFWSWVITPDLKKRPEPTREKASSPLLPRLCGTLGNCGKLNKREATRGYGTPATGPSKDLFKDLRACGLRSPGRCSHPPRGYAGTAQQGCSQA